MQINELNQRQKEASETLQGPLLILAGAGAGKTKTLVHRIENLIKSGVAPEQILAITFTNKAAKEMRERVMKVVKEGVPFVSTFHSLGVNIIKENHKLFGLPRHFSIFDKNDSKKAIKDAVLESDLDPKVYDPSVFSNKISREKSNCVTLKEYKEKATEHMEETVAKVWEKYEKTLTEEKALDFDDLLLKTYLLLKHNPEARLAYQNRWKYIHIDEYQDTNKVQYEIASLLAKKDRNICVVGDADQNIYSWRGANVENILNFEKEYPECKVILLEENYRSTKNILAAANQIIKKNTLRKDKNLFTQNGDGEKIYVIETYTETEEAHEIAKKIKDLIKVGSKDGSITNPNEIAILYRANFQSRVLEEVFLREDIPYQVLGTRFFERKEVKDVISFLKASLNPDNVSDLVRIINVPPRGIGKSTVAKIIAKEEHTLSPAFREKVNLFKRTLKNIESFAKDHTVSEILKFILYETRIEQNLKEGGVDDVERLENIKELVSLATKYDRFSSEKNEDGINVGVEKFLTDAALASDQDDLDKPIDGVKMMTVHASKGLEFEYVFIAGMEQDLFPHPKNDKNLSKSEEEEERRLFYVALTRAKKRVFLSWAHIRTIFGAQKVNMPSEFIGDIDDDFIEKEYIEEARGVKAIFIDF